MHVDFVGSVSAGHETVETSETLVAWDIMSETMCDISKSHLP